MKQTLKGILCIVLMLSLACFPLGISAAPAGGGQSASSGIKAYGCDLSFWNVGGYTPDYSLVDFEKMKADGCEFVILRVGFEGSSTRENAMDTAFLTLYEKAKAAGLGVGVYFYALATTYEGAAEDAQWCIDLFEQYDLSFEYPIYYDVEDPGNGADRPGHGVLTAEETTQLCLGWAETLEAAGYYPGTYGIYETLIKLLPAYTDIYDVWYAYVAYEDGIPEFVPEEQDHSAFCSMWQYSWEGSFDGVTGPLDVNVSYKDYPTIMKKNAYNGIPLAWDASTSVMPASFGFRPYAYNDANEGIVPTYHADGRVTLTSSVASAWAWPSAYMSCARVVDMNQTPYLRFEKSGTAHFNAAVTYIAADGSYQSANIASVVGETSGEFGSGDVTVMANFAAVVREAGHMPADGRLRVVGVTYYIMGAQSSSATFTCAEFTKAPVPQALTSSVYTISETTVSGVPAPCDVRTFLDGLDDATGVVVYAKDGTALSETHNVASGMTAAIEDNGTVIRSYQLSLIGDVNGDGTATTVDARLVLGSLINVSSLDDIGRLSADYDADGDISTADVRSLLSSVLA